MRRKRCRPAGSYASRRDPARAGARSRSRTRAPASRRTFSRGCSIPSSPRRARAPGSGSRSASASSRPTAARSGSRAGTAAARRSSSSCPSARRRAPSSRRRASAAPAGRTADFGVVSPAGSLVQRGRTVPTPVTMAQHPGEHTEGTMLIRRMAGGDREAFAAFYDRYSSLAFALIRRILPHPAEAEEVLQEVFWQSWTEADRYDRRRGSPEAWVLMRARSRAIDRLRVIRRRTETFVTPVDETLAQTADGKTPNPGVLAEDRKLVATALARLPDTQRRVIEMAFFEGLTQAEIAGRLGEPLGTVKTRTRAGLERLRGHFTTLEASRT